MSPEERSFEEWKFFRETERTANVEFARQEGERALQFDRHNVGYAQLALRSVFLANGGAVVSTLALIGALSGRKPDVSPAAFVTPFSWFGVGLFLTLGAMLFAFLNYRIASGIPAEPQKLAQHIITPRDHWPSDYSPDAHRRHGGSYGLALGAAIGALVCFALGCITLGGAFLAMR
jgi:hypothetical protein